jgi:2-hydroxychromene-2-carboxylate isomerase/NAD(P)H-dependent FMN reductase
MVGSLGTASANRSLIMAIAAHAAGRAELEIFEGLGELPPFDPEVGEAAPPPTVARLRASVSAADAVIIASPEYGFSLPGVMKNAIDWLIGSGELEGKIVALTASVSAEGRGRAGLEALSVPLFAVSARIVFRRPIVRGPTAKASIERLVASLERATNPEAPRPEVTLWFDFASTYSYPAVMRAADYARRSGVTLRLSPFLLGPIFAKQGWNDSPFNLQPAKGAWMWRDMERICADSRPPLAWRRPSKFPRSGVLAAKVAWTLGDDAREQFARAVFSANFAEDREIGEGAVVESIVESMGLEVAATMRAASAGGSASPLRVATAEAERLGIFGAPTFMVDGELYWGNDRLEAAFDRARFGGE